MSEFPVKHCAKHGYYPANLATCPVCDEQPPQAAIEADSSGFVVTSATNTHEPAKQRTAGKQRSKKVDYDGHTFDSEAEFNRYVLCLKPLADAGVIQGFVVHPLFELIPGARPESSILRPKVRRLSRLTYTADFQYSFMGYTIVEDVKGSNRKTGKALVTDAARIRHRILQMQNPHIIFLIIKDVDVHQFQYVKFVNTQHNAA